jgi:hypothetical protein
MEFSSESIRRRQTVVTLIKTDHNNNNEIYQIAGKQYAVIGEELYERLEVATIEVRPTDPLADMAPTPLRKKYKTRAPKGAKPQKKGKGKTHCKICDGYGHFAKTCPKRTGNLPPGKKPVKREITKEMVDELCAAHPSWDTLKIAEELKCRLSDVNKFW